MAGDTRMLTRAIPDTLTPWLSLVEQEEVTGKIPLPAVDSITFYQGTPPVVALLAPGIVPGELHIFVDLTAMSEADQVILDTQLQLLQRAIKEIGLKGKLHTIAHAGGLDYDLVGKETVRLQDVNIAYQAEIWAILQTIAMIGAKYPNHQSIVITPP
jgi:hypothetical protein